MNTFLEAANRRVRRAAQGAGNIAYNYLGGRQFADASRMSNKILSRGGSVTDVLRNPEYWKTIGSGTLAASQVVGAGGLVRGGLRALGKAALRTGARKPPAVAQVAQVAKRPVPQYRDPFAEDVLNPYGLRAASPKQLTRTERFEMQQATNAARRQQAAAEAEAFKKSLRIIKPPSAANIRKGTATTLATGAAGAVAGARSTAPARTQKPNFTAAATGQSRVAPVRNTNNGRVTTSAATPRPSSQTQMARTQTRGVSASPAAQQQNVYQVRSGDTLSKIAKQNNTTVQKLLQSNPKLTQNKKYQGGSRVFSGTKINLGGGR